MSYLLSGQGESLMRNISIPYLGRSTGHCAFLRVRRGRHTVRGPFLYVLVSDLYCDRLRRNACKYTRCLDKHQLSLVVWSQRLTAGRRLQAAMDIALTSAAVLQPEHSRSGHQPFNLYSTVVVTLSSTAPPRLLLVAPSGYLEAIPSAECLRKLS